MPPNGLKKWSPSTQSRSKRSSNRLEDGPNARFVGWGMKTLRQRSATAIKAGKNTRRSTKSLSPARRRTFRNRSSNNSERAADW